MTTIETMFKIPSKVQSIDESINHYASNSFCMDTKSIYDKLISLMMMKQQLIEQFQTLKADFDKLDKTTKQICYLKYAKNKTVEYITACTHIKVRTVFRRLEKANNFLEGQQNERKNTTTILF